MHLSPLKNAWLPVNIHNTVNQDRTSSVYTRSYINAHELFIELYNNVALQQWTWLQ